MASKASVSIYHHGEFKVAGGTLPNAFTAYQAYGDPANPCILVPTCYGARLELSSEVHLVGESKVLDPRKYFIVIFAAFGNGDSVVVIIQYARSIRRSSLSLLFLRRQRACSESRCRCSRYQESSLCYRVFYGRTAGIHCAQPPRWGL